MKIRSLQQVCHDFNKVPAIQYLAALLSARQQCFLVGGAIRDMFLGRPCNDFDFVTPFDPTRLAQALARHLSGSWFFLDENRRQSRVIVSRNNSELICDFGTLRASSLFSDLSLRDFKINAFAIHIRSDICPADFYDPLNGLSDLRLRQLSTCSESVLGNDPLRVLKGVRHCKILQLVPTEKTIEAMRSAVPMLQHVAEERVRKEIGLLFKESEPDISLQWLQETGSAQIIFGEWVGTGAFANIIKCLKTFDGNILKFKRSVHANTFVDILQEEFEDGFSRQAALALGVILQGRPISEVQRVIGRLKLSRMTSRALLGYCALSSSKITELKGLKCGFRGRYWWVSGLGFDPVGCLILLAFNTSEYSPELAMHVLFLVKEYTCAGVLADLVDGHWLCQHLEMKPGPRVGEALHALRCEEISGTVNSPEQAQEFLRAWFKNSIDNT